MNNNKGKKRKRIDTGRGQKEQKTIARGGGGKEKIFGYEKAKVEGGRKRLEGKAVCCVAGWR